MLGLGLGWGLGDQLGLVQLGLVQLGARLGVQLEARLGIDWEIGIRFGLAHT